MWFVSLTQPSMQKLSLQSCVYAYFYKYRQYINNINVAKCFDYYDHASILWKLKRRESVPERLLLFGNPKLCGFLWYFKFESISQRKSSRLYLIKQIPNAIPIISKTLRRAFPSVGSFATTGGEGEKCGRHVTHGKDIRAHSACTAGGRAHTESLAFPLRCHDSFFSSHSCGQPAG